MLFELCLIRHGAASIASACEIDHGTDIRMKWIACGRFANVAGRMLGLQRLYVKLQPCMAAVLNEINGSLCRQQMNACSASLLASRHSLVMSIHILRTH